MYHNNRRSTSFSIEETFPYQRKSGTRPKPSRSFSSHIDLDMRCDQVCKPSSVLNDHLSRPGIAPRLQPPFKARRASVSLSLVLLRIGFTGPRGLPRAGELLPRLSTLTALRRRYISVALSLRSPSAAVSRYPALWSSDFPQPPKVAPGGRGRSACSQKKV